MSRAQVRSSAEGSKDMSTSARTSGCKSTSMNDHKCEDTSTSGCKGVSMKGHKGMSAKKVARCWRYCQVLDKHECKVLGATSSNNSEVSM